MTLTFGSWCSGIEAASEAWLPLGWRCAYVAEIEPFPCAYLAQTHGAGRPRYMPDPTEADEPQERARRRAAIKALDRIEWGERLTNLGDISQVSAAELAPVDIIAAGFPCQDFSIAGLRASLGGRRGSLSVIGVRLLLEASELGLVRGALLEQVPDVLNTADNAWGNILGAIVGADAALEGLEHGGKWPRAGMVAGPRARVAWRILDAQHFGLAQRRERVWAVVDFGDGPDPAAVLFERKGVPGDHPAGREAGEDVAPTLAGGARKRGGFSYDDVPQVAGTITGRAGNSSRPAGAHGSLVADGSQRRAAFGGNNTSGPIDVATARTASHTASHTASGRQDFETETFVVEPVTYSIMPQNSGKDYKAREVDVAQPLMAGGPVGGNQGGDFIVQPIAFNARQDPISDEHVTGPLDTDGHTQAIAFTSKDHGADAGEIAPTMRAMGHAGSHANAGGQVAVAFAWQAGGNQTSSGAFAHDLSPTLPKNQTMAVAFSIRTNQTGANGANVSEGIGYPVQANESPQAVAFSLRGREGGAMPEVEGGDVSPSLRAAEGGSTRPFVAFDETQITSATNRSNPQPGDPCHPLAAQGRPPTLASPMAVRRITVVEAERLQGFRDNATLIDWPTANRKGDDLAETIAYLIGHGFTPEDAERLAQTPDGPRYRAIGNSWPVDVARWIGERIDEHMPERAA